jgi:hypothetical protein
MTILISVLVGMFIGSVLTFLILLYSSKVRSYSGTIKVIRQENKLVYSLELDEDPEELEHMNEVIFKVDTSDESSDRK